MVGGHVKIRFALDRDEVGWPPAASDGLWAVPVEADLYRLDSTPWFVQGVAVDDTVQAAVDDAGVLWFQMVRDRGGRNAFV